TVALGTTTQRYLRFRRDARAPLARLRDADPALVVAAVWAVGQGDARAHLASATVQRALGRSAARPGGAWLGKAGGADRARLERLSLVAAAGGGTPPAERELLRRAAAALGAEVA